MRPNEEFDEFFRATLPRARAVAMRIVGPGEADDVAAEAFARALASWRRVGPLAYREAWVLRVAANVAVDTTRRRRWPHLGHDREPLTEHDSDADLDRIALAAALASLAPRQRDVIALRYLAGLPVEQVAQVLRISANTVKTHSARGLGVLRQTLGDSKEEFRGELA